MKRMFIRTSMVGLAALAAAVPASAQQVTHAKVFEVSPYAGYMVAGKLFEGPIGTSVSSGNGPVYGAQLAMAMSRNIAVYGNIGYSSSDLKVGVPIFGGIDIGTSKTLIYDGGLELKVPMAAESKVTPFVQGGVGAIRYDIESGIVNTNATNVAYNFGGGFDVRLAPTLGVRVMAKDYLGKFDFKEVTGFDLKGKTVNNVALTLGVNFGF